MRVFVTGASGFIGSAIVRDLIAAGHEVVGLARSDASAAAVIAAGAVVHRGSLEDLESLRAGAAAADGVIHAAYIYDSATWATDDEADLRAVETLGAALEGSDRPLVVTSVTTVLAAGRVGTERDTPDPGSLGSERIAAERLTRSLAHRGVRSSVVRLPLSVHDQGDAYGFVPAVISIARDRGVSAYAGDGSNGWPAVHRVDAARVFRLALEAAPAGAVLHGAAEKRVPVRAIAEVIGRHLGVPVASVASERADEHFGAMTRFWLADVPISNTLTRELVGWHPLRPGLLDDLAQGHYFDLSATHVS